MDGVVSPKGVSGAKSDYPLIISRVKVWNVNLKNGDRIKVATVEQGPRRESMCDGCPAPCCQGMLIPILTEDEFLNRKFPISYTKPEAWFQKQVPSAQFLATLAVTNRGCPYFDRVSHQCGIWPNCPKSCLTYDCREDTREIAKFRRMRIWQAQ